MKGLVTCSLVLPALLLAVDAMAQTQAAPPSDPTPLTVEAPAKKDRGAFVLAGKVGGIVTFSGLNPNLRAAVEVGYVFPWLKRSFAAVVEVGYAAPQTDGTQAGDPRVVGGTYNWHLTEQELTVMPEIVYRLTALRTIVPYIGIGPRVYMLRSNVKGSVNGTPISETTEQSTKVGLGIPLGLQYNLGPGGLTAEVLFEYGALDHTATGDSNTGGVSLLLGYRFLL